LIDAPATARTRGQVFGAVRIALRNAARSTDDQAAQVVHDAWQVRLAALEAIAPDLSVPDDVSDAITTMAAQMEDLDPTTRVEWIDLLPRTATSLLAVRSTVLNAGAQPMFDESLVPNVASRGERVSWEPWEGEEELAAVGPSRAA
jgi:hypothetical protein